MVGEVDKSTILHEAMLMNVLYKKYLIRGKILTIIAKKARILKADEVSWFFPNLLKSFLIYMCTLNLKISNWKYKAKKQR